MLPRSTPRAIGPTWLLATASLMACNSLWGVGSLEYRANGSAGGAANSGGGGGGVSVSSGGTGGASSSTTSSTGGAGGSGGAPATTLVDDGLVVRYYLDEAASGQAPMVTVDAATAPVDLPISYDPTLEYVEAVGQRGLRWSDGDGIGRAEIVATGTKIETAIHGSPRATIEAVVNVPAAGSQHARILQLNDVVPGGGRLSLRLKPGSAQLAMMVNDDTSATDDSFVSEQSIAGAGRVVLHGVLDSESPTGDYLRLYLNGSEMQPAASPPNPVVPPTAGETITLPANCLLTIGNRAMADRAFVGTIHYVALYADALSSEDIATNTKVLAADDDTP
jgi:hypothetical protein